MSKTEPQCPCGRALPYERCCAPYHQGNEPKDAETLMRSRYAAFAKKDIRYLHRTLHPSHDDGATDYATFEASMRRHLNSGFVYRALSVLGARGEDEEGISKVLFIAKIAQRGQDRSFAELSSFARDAHGIRYLTGVTMPIARVRDLEGDDVIAEAERRIAAGRA